MLLLASTLASVALLLFLILYVRLHAFLALLLASFTLGMLTGMPAAKLLKSVQSGFGEALGFIAVVVALGAIVGRFLEHSGGGRHFANQLLERFGEKNTPWALLVSAFIVGLPIFFEVGFIILVPLAWSLARRGGKSLLYYGLPMACALTVVHAMVPPHPAPAAAAQLFGADLGLTILYGITVSIPMAIAGGIGYGLWIAKRIHIPVPALAAPEPESEDKAPPSAGVVGFVLLLPVALIFLATAFQSKSDFFVAIGHPFSALMIAAIAAMVIFGWARGLDQDKIAKLAGESLGPIGGLLAIMGGGGAFKQVIVDSGVGPYAGQLLASSNFSPLLVAYFASIALRLAQGSATVAIITAAGIVAPLVKDIPGQSPEILVLAICCGGTAISHVNDAGFWTVNHYFGLSVPQTLRTWSVMKVITSLVGILVILAADALR
jgi:gluconate transporter